jgi:protein-disulfide isomerase
MIKSFLTLGLISSTLCISAFAAENDDPVIVEIDGTKITLGEFEQKQPNVLFQARNTFYDTERKAADKFVDTYLLERQAQKENLTVPELIERHAKAALPPDPSDDALRVFYEGIPKVQQSFEEIRTRILDTIRQTRLEKAKAAYLKSLRDAAKVAVMISAPRAPVSLKDTPIRGAAKAPVTIVEFADYECPYCQQIHAVLEKVEADYKDKIAFAYKDTPLPMHSHAEKAAEAAHCAGTQGKYWEYHDALFEGRKLETAQLKDTARSLNLDGEAFDKCLDSGETSEIVKSQLSEATTYNIQGTPSFLINGRFFEGVLTYDQLRTAIEEELSASSNHRAETAQR